jgi:hypothetical protein
VRTYRDTAGRIKTLANAMNVAMSDVIDRAAQDGLDALEERYKVRLRGAARPDRTGPVV